MRRNIIDGIVFVLGFLFVFAAPWLARLAFGQEVAPSEAEQEVVYEITCYADASTAASAPSLVIESDPSETGWVYETTCPAGYYAPAVEIVTEPLVVEIETEGAPRVRLSLAASGLFGLGGDRTSGGGQGELSVTWLAAGGNGPGLAVGGGGTSLDEARSFLAFRPFYFLDLEALDLELGLRYEVAAEEWAEDPDVHAFQGSVRLLGQVDWLHLFVEVDAGFEAVSRRVRTVRDSLEGDLHATSVRPADNRFSFRALAGFAIPLRF